MLPPAEDGKTTPALTQAPRSDGRSRGARTKNTRTLERRHLSYYLSVIDRRTRQELGRLADLAAGGFMIVVPQEQVVEGVYEIEILPPQIANAALLPITATAEVRWSKPDANPDLRCVGLRFVDTPAPATAIGLLIELLGLDD